MVHVGDSPIAERSYHLVHMDCGSICLVNWYRPPSSPLDHITSLENELSDFGQSCIGFIICGDMNIHHKSWLYFSARQSPEGKLLKDICDRLSLRNCVHAPTRNQYLLDLCLSDLADLECIVTPQIADHRGFVARLACSTPSTRIVHRTLWHYKRARWRHLKHVFYNTDWRFLSDLPLDDAVQRFSDYIMLQFSEHIPQSTATQVKSTHPWLNSRCCEAVMQKNQVEQIAVASGEAIHQEEFKVAQKRCADILFEEYSSIEIQVAASEQRRQTLVGVQS